MIHPETATTHDPLLVQDRTGQTSCFNCIIETYQSQAYNLACRILSDWSLAEDAVQEALVSAYGFFRQFRGDNLAAWLMRIVANRCRDMLRSQRSRPTSPLDPLPSDHDDPDSIPSALNIPSGGESPEDHAERGDLNRAIQAGLNTLPQEQRLAVLLVDVQGFSYEEAGMTMDCSLGTVKSRVSRGRAGLRDHLRLQGELLPAQFRHED